MMEFAKSCTTVSFCPREKKLTIQERLTRLKEALVPQPAGESAWNRLNSRPADPQSRPAADTISSSRRLGECGIHGYTICIMPVLSKTKINSIFKSKLEKNVSNFHFNPLIIV